MADLVSQLLPDLETPRFAELNLPNDLVAPAYDGQSILNIPSSVAQLLGAPQLHDTPPLRTEILTPLGGEAKRVIVMLMDAFALHRLQKWVAADELPMLEKLIEQGVLAPLTSITPSTTSAAITTLWTGAPPAQHGITGYEMWLQEYGIVSNMIAHSPITYPWGVGHLSSAGFDPATFLPVGTMAAHLAKHSIQTHSFQHFSILRSGLSDMFMEGAERHGFSTPVDQWVSIRELLEGDLDNNMYVWTYWGQYDGLSHIHGPDSERSKGELLHYFKAMQDHFLDPLNDAARKDTVFILVADHGQIATTTGDPHYQLENHPSFTKRIRLMTGENRITYLYIKPGQTEAVREYIERTWPNQFHILESAFAAHHGLFGPGEPHPELLNRIGDLTLLSRGSAFLWWANKPDPLIGRHGGLHKEEMLVPFLGARLG